MVPKVEKQIPKESNEILHDPEFQTGNIEGLFFTPNVEIYKAFLEKKIGVKKSNKKWYKKLGLTKFGVKNIGGKKICVKNRGDKKIGVKNVDPLF